MELTYTIKRSSRRRKLTITVERDRSVVVHAPESTSEEKIRAVVESKRQWIYEKTGHIQKYALPHPPGKEMVNGESALYLGRQYQIEMVRDGSEKIRFEQRFLIPAHLSHERRQVLRSWYMDRAKEKILPRARKFAADLGRGDLNHACGVQQFPEIGQTLFAKSLKELQGSVRHLLRDSKSEEKKI
jgi:predicted metal-dependent hydrolase